jgi:dihydroxyacetone kinase-like protein
VTDERAHIVASIDGAALAAILNQMALDVEAQKDYLCELDGAVGDGDHGVSMTIGMRAVRRALLDLPQSPTPSEVFQAAADAYAVEVGATIGPLYEVAFIGAADASAGKATLDDGADWVAIYQSMFDAIQALGGAELGDKTMLDSFHPGIVAMAASVAARDDLPTSLAIAASTARQAAIDTSGMLALKGRASRLGARAVGHQDAGATSIAIIMESIAGSVADLSA